MVRMIFLILGGGLIAIHSTDEAIWAQGLWRAKKTRSKERVIKYKLKVESNPGVLNKLEI
jgi:hypothetical protein